MRFRIDVTVGVLAVLSWGAGQATCQNASDPWRLAATQSISEEIQFTNGTAHLKGTVYLPKTGNNLAAVVVLHHAGLPTRDANLYRHLCEGLPAIGIAVLVYDRRGSGQSSGDLNKADYQTLADDAIAGQHALAKFSRIDPNKIGFWGLSQGGWLAVLAAGRSKDAAFAIAVSAPLVTADEQMRFATKNLFTLGGYSQSDVQDMLAARKAWTGYLHRRNSRDEAVEALRKAEAKPWFEIAYLPRASQLTNDPEHDPNRRRLDDDPMAAARQAKVPLLFLYADSDPWIPVGESVKRLKSLARELPNIQYAVVSNANHEMMFPANEKMQVDQETTRNEVPQAPAYFMIVASWLTRHVAN
ncbi:MAG: alpha/beta hydrolase [Candidatus Angelobacter sp.]